MRLAETVAREKALSAEGVMRKVLGEVEVHARNGMYEDDRILLVMKVL